MTMLGVDLAQLQAAIVRMAKFGQQVSECLEDIDHTMAALRATWHGEASDSQAHAQQQWETGAEQMATTLAQLRKIATSAHTNYSEAVSKNGQMWG